MPEKPDDAKTAEESSTQQDVEVKGQDSSTEGQQTKTQTEEPTLGDVVAEAARESLAREEAAEKQATQGSQTEKETTAEVTKPSEEGEKHEEKEEPDADVPKEFHEHPAWKRIIGERNEARDKLTSLETAAKANESLLEYCRKNEITDEQFKSALQVVSLWNSDPAKCYEMLQPMVAQLESHMGLRLPEDLDK